jgi:hypothetical protein
MSVPKLPGVYLLFCVITALPVSIHAQQAGNGGVSGIVTATDGVPIPAVEVILSSPDGAVRSASTSTDGAFL